MENNIRLFEAAKAALEPLGIEVRGAGALIGLKLTVPAKDIVNKLFKMGWITGTSADPFVMRLMPPFITPPEIMEPFAAALKEVLP
jgi:acetylornithine/succinyldiaminopimelate/putrescine aminotransferase